MKIHYLLMKSSIIYHCLPHAGSGGGWSLSQLMCGKRGTTHWRSRHFITGLIRFCVVIKACRIINLLFICSIQSQDPDSVAKRRPTLISHHHHLTASPLLTPTSWSTWRRPSQGFFLLGVLFLIESLRFGVILIQRGQ